MSRTEYYQKIQPQNPKRITQKSPWGGRNLRLDLIKGVSCFLIVFLHNTLLTNGANISNGYDVLAVIIHTLTRAGVPAFMGISGYFLFFFKERPYDYGIRNLVKYLSILLIWEGIYLGYDIIFDAGLSGKTLLQYISEVDVTCSHLWYLKLYIAILTVFPIIRCITMDEKALRLFIILWCIFYSLRFTVGLLNGIMPGLDRFLEIFQLPLFEYQGYLGGTIGSERPTVFMGPFIVIGAFINLLETNRISPSFRKKIIYVAAIAYVLGASATIEFSLLKGSYYDYFFQPVETHILLMTLGYLVLFYFVPEDFLSRKSKIIVKLSECSLGVYILHPLVGRILRKIPLYATLFRDGYNIFAVNLINWLSICMVCFGISYFIKKLIPQRISKHIL